MRFGTLDIPEEILEAQENGTLVIFAGAGISLDPPANLPTYEGLAKQIEKKVKKKRKNDETIEQFFDRLQKQDNIDIKDKVKQIIEDISPEPNDYHLMIPRLFLDIDKLRVVTTNFDTLLIENGRAQPQDPQRSYPALPYGNDFSGIVFLHGNVQKPKQMVLTTSDYHQAYQASERGNANRFIEQLFRSSFTVIFIGYSHRDTHIEYIARGMKDIKVARFAFTTSNDADQWRERGVIPIPYNPPSQNGPHLELIECLKEWSLSIAAKTLVVEKTEQLQVVIKKPRLLVQRQRVIELSTTDPVKLSPEISDLLDLVESTPLLKVFIEHAKSPEWLSWIDKQGFLKPLFSPDDIKGERQSENAFYWARWLAEMGVGEGHVEALNIARRKDTVWNRILWFAVAQALHFDKDIPHDRFNHWTRALLAAPLPSGGTSHYLGYALKNCKAVERASTALLLFDRMTRPTPKRDEWPTLHEKEKLEHIRWEASFPEDDYYMREAWGKFFMPELGRFVDDVLPIAEANLRLAYETTQCTSNDIDSFDISRYQIADIEDDDHIRYNGVVDVLIDAIRDCLRWLMANRVDEGLSTARRYLRSGHALFLRLAFDALATATKATSKPDDLLTWILEADLIRPGTESSELSQLLERIYFRASQETRLAILERIDLRYAVSAEKEEDRKWVQQARLKMLRHLAKAVPECKETARRWNEAKKGVPEKQLPTGVPGERREPKGGRVVPRSPYKKDELLTTDPAIVLEKYATLQEEDFWNRAPDKGGLENQVREVASENVDFGLRLAKALTGRHEPKHLFWRAILQGWAQVPMNADDWEPVVTCLENADDVIVQYHDQTAHVLKSAIDNENRRIPFAFLPRFEQLADGLWTNIEAINDSRILSDDADWGHHAINSTAGTLTEFWLHALSWRRKESASAWRGLPNDYRNQFNRIVNGDTYGATMGQVILAGQLHFLSSLDDAWTRKRLVPLFDFKADEKRALRAWRSFSLQGRLFPTVVEMLRPQFSPLFKKLDGFSDSERRGLVQRIAAVVHYEGAKWHSNGRLAEFIGAVEDQDRVEFTDTLGRFWDANDEAKRGEAWKAWIGDYIQDRKVGKPAHFSARETGALSMWVFPFAFMADKFVKIITALPKPDLRGYIFHKIKDSDLPEKEPKATLNLTSWLLKGAKPGEFWEKDEILDIVQRLIKTGIERAELRAAIGDQCVELDLKRVLDLLDLPQN